MPRTFQAPLLVPLALLLTCAPAVFAAEKFIDWYPTTAPIYNKIVRTGCAAQYEGYLTNTLNRTLIPDAWTEFFHHTPAHLLVDCIMSNTPEIFKANMAAAAVLLGLTPTILAALGSTVEEVSMIVVVARRPFLGMLLALGAPTSFPMRPFEFLTPREALQKKEGLLPAPRPGKKSRWAVVVLEYLFAAAAIINAALLCRQLGQRAVMAWAPAQTWVLYLWAFIGAAIQLVGALALLLRVRSSDGRPSRSIIYWLKSVAMLEDSQTSLRLHIQPESYLFHFVSWVTSLLIGMHVLFGTFAFSSLVFISISDALPVVTRFLASVVCCRVITAYELAVLRDQLYSDTNEGRVDGSTQHHMLPKAESVQ